jgi:predicted permease
MHSFLKDMLFGVRSLRRMPGSAIVSVVVLAMGIGFCSFMFSVIYGVFVRGLDIPESDRFFVVQSLTPDGEQSVTLHDFFDFRERQKSFSALMGVSGAAVTVSDAGGARRLQGVSITANTFEVMGVSPMLGRGFAAGEDTPGSPPNVVLGYTAWRDQFGGEQSVIGRAVTVNGEAAQIIGVMPEGFAFPFNNNAWIPFRGDPVATARGQNQFVNTFGRLADGVSREQAEQDLTRIATQLKQEYPENQATAARLETPSRAATDGPLIVVFGAMLVAVFCVLLVACANVANLLLARAATRTKEAAVRSALGGGRLRVMTPLLAESLVLATAGALLGILIAYVTIGWFDGVTDPSRTGRPYFIRFIIDWPILGFVAGITMFTALLAGIAPAWKMSRTDVNTVLKDEARGSTGLQIGKLSLILVTAEVALSCALLVGAGLMTKSIMKLGGMDYAFETEGLFTARIALSQTAYPDRNARQLAWDDLLRELRAEPTIARAAFTSLLPMTGSGGGPVAIDGVTYENEEAMPEIGSRVVSPGFFDALGAPISAGRDFTELDVQGSDRVAIVNQSMVDRYFAGGNALGRMFRRGVSDTLPNVTVVGVIADLGIPPQPPGGEDPEPAIYYVPLAQSDPQALSIVATPRSGDPMALTAAVRATVARFDSELPIFDVRTQEEVIDRATWFFGVFGTVFIVFGLAALFMASVGLYGVLSFAVSRRTQEMGIRMALGASSRDVMRLVVRQGLLQLGIGLLIGMGAAFGLTRVIGFLMYQVDPQDPLVFVGVLALILLVGLAAAVVPARRATSVDPVEALRSE